MQKDIIWLGTIVLVGALLVVSFCVGAGHFSYQEDVQTYTDKPTIIFYGADPPKIYQGDVMHIDSGTVLFQDATTGKAWVVSAPFEIIHHEAVQMSPIPQPTDKVF